MLGKPEKIESDFMSVDCIVGQMFGMSDNTLSILNNVNYNELYRIQSDRFPSRWDDLKSDDSDESVKTVKSIKAKRGCYKKRKNSSRFTKVTSTLIDDGYAWRKYGQKVILNTKHQRCYYRCTHKIEQGCKATKQVQMTEDEPPKFRISYFGHHTCNNLLRAPQIILDSSNPRDNSILLNFETNTSTQNKQVGPCLSTMQHNNVSSSDDCIPWDLPWDLVTQISQVPSEPISEFSSEIDHVDMISSGIFSSTCSSYGYEIDDMFGSNDFGDLFESCL